jgi:hypothetical protein
MSFIRRLLRLDKGSGRPSSSNAFRQAMSSLQARTPHTFRILAPLLLSFSIAAVAHAQGTMDFSGAQTLMGTFKTTIATLLQFKTLETLRHKTGMENHKDLVLALNRCGAMKDDQVVICGCRLALESEYRDFWELPYDETIKTGLMHALLQARAVISWFQSLTESRRSTLDDIEIIFRDVHPGKVAQIGGSSGSAVYERACLIEKEIYRIGAALVPPKKDALPGLATEGYEPFAVIQGFRARSKTDEQVLEYQPLIVLDDAHSLHPQQLSEMLRWLARREQRVARWVLMRLDAQSPQEALLDSFDDDDEQSESAAAPKVAREVTTIWLQRKSDRRSQRVQFRQMGRQMADRYLRLMDVFSRNGITSLANLLDGPTERLPASKEKELARKVLPLVSNPARVTALGRWRDQTEYAEPWTGFSPVRSPLASSRTGQICSCVAISFRRRSG